MTDAPLVLYLASSIDARAGAELIRERWPGSRLETFEPTRKGPQEGGVHRAQKPHEDDIWLLGIAAHHDQPAGIHVIDPTPDASIAMQVWLLLHGGKEPPWDVGYVDAAARGQRLPAQAEVMAYLQTIPWGHDHALGPRVPWERCVEYLDRVVVIAGRAILRARDRDAARIAELEAMLDSTADRCTHVEETAARLRAERDEWRAETFELRERLATADADCEASTQRLERWKVTIRRLRAERDDLARAVLDAEGRAAELRRKLAGVDDD